MRRVGAQTPHSRSTRPRDMAAFPAEDVLRRPRRHRLLIPSRRLARARVWCVKVNAAAHSEIARSRRD